MGVRAWEAGAKLTLLSRCGTAGRATDSKYLFRAGFLHIGGRLLRPAKQKLVNLEHKLTDEGPYTRRHGTHTG
jgi:hypothetical protein